MSDLRRKGSHLLGILNDLKRNDEVAAKELDVSVAALRSWLSGQEAIPEAVLQKAASIWPVSRKDLEIVEDDALSGVRFMTADESAASERVLSRAKMPYYAYRDTAMSRVSAFRPEWIQELVAVDDNNPDNPLVQWNNGHFLHQFTYFVGPVNFYYMKDSKRCVAEMNTGDSMYISPFIPHSFATRKNNDGVKGLILALTFGSKLFGEARQEMAVLGDELVRRICPESYQGKRGFAALLRQHLLNTLVSEQLLAERTGLNPEKISAWLCAESMPAYDEMRTLAAGLQMNARDLLPFDELEPLVVVRKVNETEAWTQGAYRIRALSGSRVLPDMRGFEFTVNAGAASELVTSLFQYAYVLNGAPVTLKWKCGAESNSRKLNAGDSFVMKPGIVHSFESAGGKVLVLRAGGRLSGDALLELATFGHRRLSRAVTETVQWYNPEGTKR